MICVLTAGFLHKNDIQTLLSQEKEMKVKRNTKKSVSITFIAIYILGIVMMFMNPHEATAYIVPTLVGLGGAVGMIRYVLPDVVRNLKRGVFLTKRYVLISISNLNYLMTVAVTGMLAILAANIHSPREFTTGVIGYVVVIVLLVVSIIYKLSMEAMTRRKLFLNLWKIGYTRKELRKIVGQEVISYYLILIFIPLVYIAFISGRFIYYGDMTYSFAFLYALSYIIPIIISGFITYFQYLNAVVKPIKGGE